jgi:hypothetical protein
LPAGIAGGTAVANGVQAARERYVSSAAESIVLPQPIVEYGELGVDLCG